MGGFSLGEEIVELLIGPSIIDFAKVLAYRLGH